MSIGERPLEGKCILVTRSREQSPVFSEKLRELGARVIEFPTIEIVPPLRWDSLDSAIENLHSYDWLIFTSINGVKNFFLRLDEKGVLHLPPDLKVCAIGPATARGIAERGIPVDYIPEEYVAEAVVKGFERMGVKGKRFLIVRAAKARDVLPEGLRRLGGEVEVVEAYRTVKPREGASRLREILSRGGVDMITFTSSSTVEHFVDLLEEAGSKELLKGITVACIGPVTSRTAKERGIAVHIQPSEYTIPALIQAIAQHFKKERRDDPPPPGSHGKEGSFKSVRPDVDVILFDLGNVILPFDHRQIAEKLFPFVRNERYRDPDKVFDYLFKFRNGAVNPYETGKLSTDRFFDSIKQRLNLELSFNRFREIWNEIFTEDEEVSEIVCALKDKRRLGLVSNTNPLHFEYILSRFPVVRCFDGWILSYEVGYKKPAFEIYEKAIEWASVPTQRILFIDDSEANVDAAISLGLKGVHFSSAQQLRKTLFTD